MLTRAEGIMKPLTYLPLNNDNILVGANYSNEISFTGIINLKVLKGAARVFGYELTPTRKSTTIISIKEISTYNIQCNSSSENQNNSYDIKSYLEQIDINPKKEILQMCDQYSNIFLFSRNHKEIHRVEFLKRYNNPIFANKEFAKTFFMVNNSTCADFKFNEDWESISEELMNKNSRVLIAGGIRTGKSSFLQYLVNWFLKKHPRVLIIDLDPGQNGFSLMGCINAVFVEEPLLRPNFSNSLKPLRSLFLGDISVMSCYKLYKKCVSNLFDFINQPDYKDVPCIINTMGFTKGFGLHIMATLIQLSTPSDVIQINSPHKKFNFRCDLDSNNVGQILKQRCLNYKLHIMSTCSPVHLSNRDFQPSIRRNMVIMGYFADSVPLGKNLLDAPAKKICISRVYIYIQKPVSREYNMNLTLDQKLCTINGMMVALCHRCPETEFDLVHGFGIVRGFDRNTNDIYLITPLDDCELSKVNVIKSSSIIHLPNYVVFQNTLEMHGLRPFVTSNNVLRSNQRHKKTSGRIKHAPMSA